MRRRFCCKRMHRNFFISQRANLSRAVWSQKEKPNSNPTSRNCRLKLAKSKKANQNLTVLISVFLLAWFHWSCSLGWTYKLLNEIRLLRKVLLFKIWKYSIQIPKQSSPLRVCHTKCENWLEVLILVAEEDIWSEGSNIKVIMIPLKAQ